MVNRLGTYIRERREALGLSQRKLAERAKVSRSAVNRVEAGDTIPETRTLEAIATALEVPLTEILDLVQGRKRLRGELIEKIDRLRPRDRQIIEELVELMLIK